MELHQSLGQRISLVIVNLVTVLSLLLEELLRSLCLKIGRGLQTAQEVQMKELLSLRH